MSLLLRVTAGWMLVCLFCVLPIALATLVDNTDRRIIYTGSGWTADDNPKNNGGSANRTNVKGDSASFNFTGNAIALYGASQEDGASFSFTIDGTSKLCTCYQNKTVEIIYQTPLCWVSDLVPTFHTLVITHAGSRGLWLNIDDFQVVLNEATRSPSATTSASTSTSVTTSPTPSSKSGHRGVLIGAIAGGTVALLCILGGIAFLRFKSSRKRQTKEQQPQTPPGYSLPLTTKPGNTRPLMELESNSPGIASTQPVRDRVLGQAQGAREYAAADVPPPNLTSKIERSNQSAARQSPTSNRSSYLRPVSESISGRGDISFYFPALAAATPSTRQTPLSPLSSSAQPPPPPPRQQHSRLPPSSAEGRRRQSSSTTISVIAAPRPRRFRLLPDIWGERRRRDSQFDGYSDVLHTRSELASPPPLSSVSPPPPSYRSDPQTPGGA